MSRTSHDSPYRDDPSPSAERPRSSSSRPARTSKQPRQQDRKRKSQPSARDAGHKHAANGTRGSHGSPASSGPRTGNGAHPRHAPQPPRDPRTHAPRHAPPPPTLAATPTATAAPPAGRRRSRRRGRGGGAGAPTIQLTSHPTGRAAYADTRAWLLKEHGAICAYCAREFTPQVMTLDHVAPRRGQTAYDRRDNLVLACRGCNEAKRDLSPLAYLLAVRARAANLLRYGAHLSPGLLDLARSLLPKDLHSHHHAPASNGNGDGASESNGSHATAAKRPARELFGGADDDDESPYKD